VINWETGAIVFVGNGKGENALKPFWKRVHSSHAKIQAVATDMSSAYYAAVLKNLPKAKHVFDRFHIIKLMNDKLTELRRRMHAEAEAMANPVLKGIRWLLLKREGNVGTLGWLGNAHHQTKPLRHIMNAIEAATNRR
jgi:transposase